MGLFDHLFKSKPAPAEEKIVESPGKPEEAAKPADPVTKSSAPAPRPASSDFLHPKNFVPRGTPPSIAVSRSAPPPSVALKHIERKPAAPTTSPKDEIVLTLGDVLSRIPTHCLKPGPHDAKREMRFHMNDLSSDIARGRAAVPLSRIAQLLPDIFVKEITADDDTEIRLPLQKLVEQIGLLRSRPATTPAIEKSSRAPVQLGAAPVPLPMEPVNLLKEELIPLGTPPPQGAGPIFQDLNTPAEATAKLDLAPQPAAPAKITLPSSALWLNREEATPAAPTPAPQELRPSSETNSPAGPESISLAPLPLPSATAPEAIQPKSEPASVSKLLPPIIEAKSMAATPVVPTAPDVDLPKVEKQGPPASSIPAAPAKDSPFVWPTKVELPTGTASTSTPLSVTPEAVKKEESAPVASAAEALKGQPLEPISEAVRPAVSLPPPALNFGAIEKSAPAAPSIPVEHTEEPPAFHFTIEKPLAPEPRFEIHGVLEPIVESEPAVKPVAEVIPPTSVPQAPSPIANAPFAAENLTPVEVKPQGPEIAAEKAVEKPDAPSSATAAQPSIVIEWPSFGPEPSSQAAQPEPAVSAPESLLEMEILPPLVPPPSPAPAIPEVERPTIDLPPLSVVPQTTEASVPESTTLPLVEATLEAKPAAAADAPLSIPFEANVPATVETKLEDAGAVTPLQVSPIQELPVTHDLPTVQALSVSSAQVHTEIPAAEAAPTHIEAAIPIAPEKPSEIPPAVVEHSATPSAADLPAPNPMIAELIPVVPEAAAIAEQPLPPAPENLAEPLAAIIEPPSAPLSVELPTPSPAPTEAAPITPEATTVPEQQPQLPPTPAFQPESHSEPSATPIEPPAAPLVTDLPAPSPAPAEVIPAAAEAVAISEPTLPPPSVLKPVEEDNGEEQILLSLAAILRTCPPEIVVGPLPQVAESVRIKLPFAPIDRQLVKGHVEVSAMRFVAALPAELQKHFSSRIGVRVPIPLEEIFQNLPQANSPAALATPPPNIPRPVTINPESIADPSALSKSAPVLSSAPGTEVKGFRWEPPAMAPITAETAPVAGITLVPKTPEPGFTPEAEMPLAANLNLTPEPPVADLAPSALPVAPVVQAQPEPPVAAEIPAVEPAAKGPSEVAPVETTPTAEQLATHIPVAETAAVHSPKAEARQEVIEEKPSVPPPLPSNAPEPVSQTMATPEAEAPRPVLPPRPNMAEILAATVEEKPGEAIAEPSAPAEPVPQVETAPPASAVENFPPTVSSTSESPAPEPAKLVLQPPMFRPMVLPPPIFGFKPADEAAQPGETPATPEGAPTPAAPVEAEPPGEVPKFEITAAPEAPVEMPIGEVAPVVQEAPAAPVPAPVEVPVVPPLPVALQTPLAEEPPKAEVAPAPFEEPVRLELAPEPPAAPAPEPELAARQEVTAPASTVELPPELPPLFAALAKMAAEPPAPLESTPASIVPDINDAAPSVETASPTEKLAVELPPEIPSIVAQAESIAPSAATTPTPEVAGEPSENAPTVPFEAPLIIEEAPAVIPPPLFGLSKMEPPAPVHDVPGEGLATPPALPLTRFDQDALQALFMTEETLDLPKVSRLAASLPGVHACVIATRDQAVTGGKLPEGFDLAALLGLAPRVGEAASRMPIGALKHFTLYGERYAVSFFERNGLSLCAVHRPRSFVPGVREKLVAIADELSKS